MQEKKYLNYSHSQGPKSGAMKVELSNPELNVQDLKVIKL